MRTNQHDGRRQHRTRSRFALAVLALVTTLGLVAVPELIGSAGAAVPPGSPVGLAEHILDGPGGLTVTGWAYDPDTTAPISGYLTLDGKALTTRGGTVVAADPRPDLAARYPAAVGHGYATSVLIPTGKHTVCAWSQNATGTPGADQLQRCVTRTFNYNPVGAVQTFKTVPGAIQVGGWAADTDSATTALTIKVRIDKATTSVIASRANTAAAKAYPTFGPDHGFSVTIPASQGKHTVCITAVSVGAGKDTSLRCGTLTLAESPVGHLDTVARSGKTIHVRGWAYDPDARTSALKIALTVDGRTSTVTADRVRNDVASSHAGVGSHHGFDVYLGLAEGTHRICVTAKNVSFGSDVSLGCRTVTLNFTPSASITSLTSTSTGLRVGGWASDPDTSAPIKVTVAADGRTKSTVTANAKASSHSGHAFSVPITERSGKHTVCVTGINAVYGTHNSKPACKAITLTLSPLGKLSSLKRAAGSDDLVATGWTFDPDTTSAISVAFTLDGKTVGTYPTTVSRPDITKTYPSAGSGPHGFAQLITADDGEHTVCATAVNVSGGRNAGLGCVLIIAVHPVAPSAVQTVTALAGYGGATVSWTRPASDGGAPWSSYTVRSSDGRSVTAGPTSTSATILGLKPTTTYTFTVTATNVAGTSPAVTSPPATTAAAPPAQTTPAPVSTSRYVRNVSAATSKDLATMRSEGAADARANPSGHGYLILLDIGGQDQYNGGVVLSATTHFVSYANLVKDVNAYVDGYASAQRASAPVTIAIGTNNDVDVSSASGKAWAANVINPIRGYASRYLNMVIAGANDIEPGFRATYSQTKSWLTAYLAATTAPFIFNGSADGCAWTVTNRHCNNGWTMAGLYYLAGGAAPVRTLNLPQVYNNTMAAQWKFISLTGVGQGNPRINFGGPLTEWTACDQTHSCGSLTGNNAWAQMWRNLQSDPRLAVGSLPYSTDLRIN